MKPSTCLPTLLPTVLLFAALLECRAAPRVIDEKMYHLGTPGFPEWEEFAGSRPHGRNLHLNFAAKANTSPLRLLIRQEGVKHGWTVYLNQRRLGLLSRNEARLDHAIDLPAGGLREGTNSLSIRAPKQVDDIRVGNLRLMDAEAARGVLEVRVTEDDRNLPCRITVTHPDGTLADLQATAMGDAAEPAARPGVVYTGNGRARIRLSPGPYRIYASRGFEYSVAAAEVVVSAQKPVALTLNLKREVDTRGWVAADTHIHVRDFSGHGDSTVQERMLTIAGEGVELAIATDHNHHTDYYPFSTEMKVSEHFTSVIGNEVTTRGGHFNAFPIEATAPVPDYRQTNWAALISGIRRAKGVKVIVLNHPRNVHSGYSPMSTNEFNRLTGAHRQPIGFDAMEVVTSAAMQSDIMAPFRDWFALLNRGQRVVGVASSDTHDVARFALGQARTYVKCPDADVSALDVDLACRSFLDGHALISMGLLTRMTVNGRYRVGDFVPGASGKLNVTVEVTGPTWTSADRIELFANGIRVGQRELTPRAERVVKARETFTIGPFGNDVHLVAIATGPGVMQPYFETPRPYQPTSRVFRPRLIGATNPIWVDADGDGRYSSPYATAGRLVGQADILRRLEKMDPAVAAQAASLLRQRRRLPDEQALAGAAPHVRAAFERVIRSTEF